MYILCTYDLAKPIDSRHIYSNSIHKHSEALFNASAWAIMSAAHMHQNFMCYHDSHIDRDKIWARERASERMVQIIHSDWEYKTRSIFKSCWTIQHRSEVGMWCRLLALMLYAVVSFHICARAHTHVQSTHIGSFHINMIANDLQFAPFHSGSFTHCFFWQTEMHLKRNKTCLWFRIYFPAFRPEILKKKKFFGLLPILLLLLWLCGKWTNYFSTKWTTVASTIEQYVNNFYRDDFFYFWFLLHFIYHMV